MKKIIIPLIATLVVFVTTLVVTDRYVTEQFAQASDRRINKVLDTFSDDFDDNLYNTRSSVYGFLTGIFTKETSGNSDFVYVDSTNKQFFKVDLKKRLASFLKANPYYTSAMFIIQRDSTKDSFYAPLLYQGGETLIDIAQNHDFWHSANFRKCRETKKSFWAIPSENSVVTGRLITFYVPLCRHRDGTFFGAFALNIDISTLHQKIENHLPYGHNESEMLVADGNGKVIASYPVAYENAPSSMALDEMLKRKSKTYVADSAADRRAFTFRGKKYYQYERDLKFASWKVVTVCSSDAVYAKSHHISHVVLLISFIGTLFMLVGVIFISRLIRRSYKARIAAEQELSMAANVQARMLRKSEYTAGQTILNAFIRPAREAGGDLYDYTEVDGKLIFCIGDVSGKGMPAALFMTQVISLFRSAIARTTDPAAIIASINDVLSDANPDMTFCTLFVAVLDGDTLTFCNAGHNKPVLLPADATIPCYFVNLKPNVAVGLMSGFPYVTEQCTLHSGDTLLLYTDGVTEAKNNARNMFGDQAVIDTLSHRTNNTPKHVTTILVDAVTTFVAKAEQSDDITILTVQR